MTTVHQVAVAYVVVGVLVGVSMIHVSSMVGCRERFRPHWVFYGAVLWPVVVGALLVGLIVALAEDEEEE